MLRKLTILAALLAMLLACSAPLVLAQQNAGEELPPEPFLGGSGGGDLFLSGDEAIGCNSVFGDPSDDPLEEVSSPVGTSPEAVEEAQRLCLENGYVPPNAEIQYDKAANTTPDVAH